MFVNNVYNHLRFENFKNVNCMRVSSIIHMIYPFLNTITDIGFLEPILGIQKYNIMKYWLICFFFGKSQ